MPFPKPLAALMASLMAGSSAPEPTAVAVLPPSLCGPQYNYDDPRRNDPRWLEEVKLGPYRFCVPAILFHGHHQPSGDGNQINFALDWPGLQPLPPELDVYKDTNVFLSTLPISVDYLHRLTDEEYRVLPRRWIEPFDPTNPIRRANPSENLDLRIKGDPVHGLTPYYTDFDRVRRFHGPDSPGARPDNMNEDWFLDMGEDDLPRTVIKCDPQAVPDGVRIDNGRMVVIPGVFRRAGCTHEFFMPEYKAMVRVDYQRIVMPDWQRIETRIRTLLHQGEINR